MIIKTLPVGNMEANCYIIGCEETKAGVVVDPGDNAAWILRTVAELGLSIMYVIDTHGHVDHIGANGGVKQATGASLLIHEADATMLTDATHNLSAFMGSDVLSPPADRLLQDREEIAVGNLLLEVIHTPGHTPGGICLKVGNHVFTGDTLFAGSIGRSDFPGGNGALLVQKIKEKLLDLPEDCLVYPGHGPTSTIGEEKQSNPFL